MLNGVQKITVAWFSKAAEHSCWGQRGMFTNQALRLLSKGTQAQSGILASAAFEQNSDPDLGFKAILYELSAKDTGMLLLGSLPQ